MKRTPTYEVFLGDQYEADRRPLIGEDECESARVAVCVVSQSLEDGGIEFSLTARNNSDHEVSEIVFPCVSFDPAAAPSGFTMPVGPGWWLPFEEMADGEAVVWNYPVYGSMQWIDYDNRSSGVYVGVHDQTPYIKLFEVGKTEGRPRLRVRFTDIRLMPGETFALPPVVVWEHEGNWRAGAKRYRAWAETWMERPQGAEWYREAPAWSWYGFKAQHARKPDRKYADIPSGAQLHAQHGIRLLNAAGWLEHGHDTHYPDYVAGGSMGGADALRSAVREVHRQGSRISLYVNGRIADPEGSIGRMPGWQSWAAQAPSPETAVRVQRLHANFRPDTNPRAPWNTDGGALVETYGRVDFAVMCPGSREWRELLTARIEALARDYEVDGVFIDQVCGAWACPCYSDSHDHVRPNEAWGGYLEMLRDLRARVRAINPEFQMSTEGVCDIFGQFFDVQQGHNDWNTHAGPRSRPMPELYAFTFPCYTVNTGFASRNDYYHLKLAHAVGSGLDVCDLERDRPEGRYLDLLRRATAWRAGYVRELRDGEFLGSLESDCPGYLAHGFERGGRAVITAGRVPYGIDPPVPPTVTLRLPGKVARVARAYSESGEMQVSVRLDRADTLFTVPVTEIALLEVDYIEASEHM